LTPQSDETRPQLFIPGDFTDSNNLVHGFLLYRGIFTIFDFPAATGTFASDINDRVQVVGTYLDSDSKEHGFLLNNGTFTSIDFPGGVAGTEAIGLNNRGEIVGVFVEASGNGHGFLLSKGVFTTIDFPRVRSSAFMTTATVSSTASG
jgi:uncharacterized membrane protein